MKSEMNGKMHEERKKERIVSFDVGASRPDAIQWSLTAAGALHPSDSREELLFSAPRNVNVEFLFFFRCLLIAEGNRAENL